MTEKPEIVQIQMDKVSQSQSQMSTKALQIKIGQNKMVVVYNHIQGYILDAFLKAVFDDAH